VVATGIPKEAGTSERMRRDQSDSTFTLSEVAPGQYTLVAIDHGHELTYEDATEIKPYLA
jgi:hypothetical protein